jgi:tetratricopeptide (TPR) repeat protein
MIRLLYCLAFGLVVLPAAAPAADFATLVAQCASPDPRTAIAACTDIIAAGDDMGAQRFTALTARARAELGLDEPDLTIADDTAALAINPQSGQAFETRGRAYDVKSNFTAAIADETQAVKYLPQNLDAVYWLGVVEDDAGSFKQAVVDQTKAIALSPYAEGAYIERALDYDGLGDLTAERNDLDRALILAPRDTGVYILRGNLFNEMNKYDLGIKDFNAALALDPGNPFAQRGLGFSFFGLGDWHHAVDALTTAINNTRMPAGTRGTCLGERGFAFLDSGDQDQAIADLSAAIKLNPRDYSAYGGLAAAYHKKHAYKLALQDDETAIQINPKYVYAYLGMSQIYIEQKNFAGAVTVDQRLIALTPNDGVSWNHLCWDRAHFGQLKAALANCQKAVTLAPTDANIWDSYGYVCLQLRKNALAVKYYSRALVIKPAFASSLFGRALAEQALGDKIKAAADRAAAVKLEPGITNSFGTL